MSHLFKNKGSKTAGSNYQGISLFSIVSKILARIMLNCLIANISEEYLPENKRGIRPNCSKIDMIFSVHQVQKKYRAGSFR